MGARLALQQLPGDDPPECLPLEVRTQPPLARAAYAMLLAKPGRTLTSISRELGVEANTIQRLARAGRWAYHIRDRLNRNPEHLAILAQEEARRSRAGCLANNRVFEEAVSSALANLVDIDEQGNVRLKPGVEPGDVEKVARARQTHVKTTQLLTGEAAAAQRSAAAAGAARIILGGALQPTPITLEATEVQG